MSGLVLSLFPGIDLLGLAFKREGFCVVQGGDVIWGGDIRDEHYPAGRFDGVIGGPPCKLFSTAAPIRRGNPPENLIPEFERVIREVQPIWFVMENVQRAPLPAVDGYQVADYFVNNRWFGAEQQRKRRFSFGYRGERRPLHIEPTFGRAARVLRTVTASDGKRNGRGSNMPGRRHTITGQVLTISQACEAQGLPPDFLDAAPFTKAGSYSVVGQGVPIPMGRAIAKAVKEAVSQPPTPASPPER